MPDFECASVRPSSASSRSSSPKACTLAATCQGAKDATTLTLLNIFRTNLSVMSNAVLGFFIASQRLLVRGIAEGRHKSEADVRELLAAATAPS